MAATHIIAVWARAQLRQQTGIFRQIVTTFAANIGQFRQAWDFNTPAFIITQMEVEFVELIS